MEVARRAARTLAFRTVCRLRLIVTFCLESREVAMASFYHVFYVLHVFYVYQMFRGSSQTENRDRRLFAGVELENNDAGVPIDTRGPAVFLVVVHLAVPEGAVVTGIDAHAAVVAPTLAVTDFDGGALHPNYGRFHFPRRISHESSGVPDARFHRSAGGAHAQGDVALFIHGHSAHPQAGRLVLEGPGLVERELSSHRSGAQFVPAHGRQGGRAFSGGHGMGYNHGFVVAEIPVGKAEEQTIAQRLHLFSRRRLRNAVAAAASESIRRHRNGVRSGKGGLLRMNEVHVKIVFIERVAAIAQLDVMIGCSAWRKRS